MLRYQKDKILEFKVEVPAGTVIFIPANYQLSVLNFRKNDGSTERSSTGFVTPVSIVSVPKEASTLTDKFLAGLTETSSPVGI